MYNISFSYRTVFSDLDIQHHLTRIIRQKAHRIL